MIMKETLIKTIHLENRLTLNLYDASRKIAADRWIVSLIARIDIPVDPEFIGDNENLNDMKHLFGNALTFEKRMDRHFIDTVDKDSQLKNLVTSFSSSTQLYLSHPKFPQKYILKQYADKKLRQTWYK